MSAELDGIFAKLDELEAIRQVAVEFLPEAIPFNTLPDIIRGIALQRDAQHELKDHLAEVARKLTEERDGLEAENEQLRLALSKETYES